MKHVSHVVYSGLKLITVDRAFAESHYADLSAKPFFNGLVEYIISGPVVAMVWEGKNVVATGRKIIGATNPAESAPGTIRGDYAIDIGRWGFLFDGSFQNLGICSCENNMMYTYDHIYRNVIHGSDAVESARKEIALWFPEGIAEWRSSLHSWIYEWNI